MPDFHIETREWTKGYQGHLAGDSIPPNGFSDAIDSHFIDIGMGEIKVATRPGSRLVAFIQNELGISVYGRYCHMHNYYQEQSASSYTNYLFMVNEVGHVTYKDPSDVNLPGSVAPPTVQWPAADPISNTVLFTKGMTHIDSTNMNNRAFFVNGEGQKRSILGLEGKHFGLPTPQFAATVATGGSADMPPGVYDVGIVTYNEDTGAYSNLSEVLTLTIVAGERLKVDLGLTAAELSQITHWIVYLRRQATQRTLLQVQRTEDVSGVTVVLNALIPKATTTVYVDLSSTEQVNNIIPAPTSTENSGPPDDMLFVATFGRRLIGASRRKIYWSKVDLPDAFPPENEEVVDTGEGDTIVGIYPFSDELLLVFTETATFGLFGNDPQYWTLRPIDLTVGCAGHKSVMEFEGKVAWWSPAHGPVLFDGQKIDPIGYKGYSQEFLTNTVFTAHKHRILGGWDPYHSVILWAVPDPENVIYHETGSTAPTGIKDIISNLVLPYNYRIGQWSARAWYTNPIDAMATSLNNRREQRLFYCNHVKSLFYFDFFLENDIQTTFTTTGTFTAGSSSISSITDGAANFGHGNLYGNIIEGANVTLFDSAGQFVGRSIISFLSSDTVMNLKKAIDVTSGQTYTYYVGSPFFKLTTGWWDADQAFLRKRWDRLYAHFRYNEPTVPIYVDIQLNNDSTGSSKTLSVVTTGEQATLDATWDVNVYTQWPYVKKRFGLWLNGHMLRTTIRQGSPHRVVVDKLGIMGRTLSDRYFG